MASVHRFKGWAAALTVLIVLAAATFAAVTSAGAGGRGAAIALLSERLPPQNTEIAPLVIASYHEFRVNAVRWSAAYFGALFGAAFLSALAALLLKLEALASRPGLRSDLAAISAATSALLITLSTTGDFQRKWQANRLAASEMEVLAYDLLRADVPREQVIARLQSISAARNAGIVGDRAAKAGASH